MGKREPRLAMARPGHFGAEVVALGRQWACVGRSRSFLQFAVGEMRVVGRWVKAGGEVGCREEGWLGEVATVWVVDLVGGSH